MKVCMSCGNEFERDKEGVCPYCKSGDIYTENRVVAMNEQLNCQWHYLRMWLNKQINNDRTSGKGIRIGSVLDKMDELE